MAEKKASIMDKEYVLKSGGSYLNGFYPNDLIRMKNDRPSFSGIIKFSRKNCYIFGTADEAIRFQNMMVRKVGESRERYKTFRGVTDDAVDDLMRKIMNMKVGRIICGLQLECY